MKVTHPELYALVLQAAKAHRTAQQLAGVVGISLSAMLRGAKTGHLSVDVLLAIADVGGLNPTALLQASGRGETAKRIERLYGKPRTLSPDDRALLALDDDSKRQLRRLVEGLTR